jgi:DNA-binding response OmpR family regulator
MTIENNDLPGERILLIDDDIHLLEVMQYAFSQVGYQVYTATDGQMGLRQLFEHQPDVVILDLIMPGMDGWETCRKIREVSTVSIIILTGLEKDEQVIRGLDAGADDYLVKPVGLDKLIAQVRAKLRRGALPPSLPQSFVYNDGYLIIDLNKQQVFIQGQLVELTQREYRLLAHLYRHADQIRPHAQILEAVWGSQGVYSVDVIHKNIRRLRRKLEVDPQHPRYVLTQHGLGYRFKKPYPS